MQTCIDTCTCTECMNPHTCMRTHSHKTHTRSQIDVWLTIHRMSLSASSTTQHPVQEQHCMLAKSLSAPGWTRIQEIPLEWQVLTHNTPYSHLLMVLQHPSLSCELECVYVCTNTVVHTTYIIFRGGGTDFSLGGGWARLWHGVTFPKRGVWGHAPPWKFLKYRCYKINSGAVLALSIPHSHVSNCNKLKFS